MPTDIVMGPTRRPSYSISRSCTPRGAFQLAPRRSLRARSHDKNELFSAVAGDDILAPRSRQHVLAYCTQHRVSRGVPSVS